MRCLMPLKDWMLTSLWRLKSLFPMTWRKWLPSKWEDELFMCLLCFIAAQHLNTCTVVLSRLHLLAAQPAWPMSAQMGSTWQMPVTVEQSWACRRWMAHGAPCPFLGTTTLIMRPRSSGSGPCTRLQRETQWSQMAGCWGWALSTATNPVLWLNFIKSPVHKCYWPVRFWCRCVLLATCSSSGAWSCSRAF